MPISHDCPPSHGDQRLLPDHELHIDDEKKEFLNQKDDLRNPRQHLALKGLDYSDISLFENWEIVWPKMSRGDSGDSKKTLGTTRN